MPGSAGSADYPPLIKPMLAVPAAEIPEPEAAWGAEFKWDGVRAVAYVSAGELRLLSRSGRDMTRAYPELAELGRQAGPRDMVLDGEIAAFTSGRPSFAALQRRMHVGAPTGRLVAAIPVTYLVFDIMYSGGQPLIAEPYAQRRAILEAQPLAGPARARPAVVSRRREGRARGQRPRRPGGCRGQAPRLALPARAPVTGLAEDQEPAAPGRGRGRPQPRARAPRRADRLAPGRDARRSGPRLRRPRRHRLHPAGTVGRWRGCWPRCGGTARRSADRSPRPRPGT